MSEVEIPVYGEHSIKAVKFEYAFDLTDLDDIYKLLGFTEKKKYLNAFFYLDDGLPFVEIISFKNPKTKEYIIDLWDDNGAWFSFFCYGERELLSCLKDFMELAQQRCSIERNIMCMKKAVQ